MRKREREMESHRLVFHPFCSTKSYKTKHMTRRHCMVRFTIPVNSKWRGAWVGKLTWQWYNSTHFSKLHWTRNGETCGSLDVIGLQLPWTPVSKANCQIWRKLLSTYTTVSPSRCFTLFGTKDLSVVGFLRLLSYLKVNFIYLGGTWADCIVTEF